MSGVRTTSRSVRIAGLGLLVSSVFACSAILGLPSPTLDDGITGDGGADGSGQDGSTSDSPVSTGDGSDAQGCGDVSTSLSNCGACGHDCTGGRCADGLCELTRFLEGPVQLAVDSSNVYVSLATSGSVIRCSTKGCGANPLVLVPADSTLTPWGIGTNATHVFFAGYATDGGVYRVQLDGGNLTDMTLPFPLEGPTGIALDSTKVYWTNYGSPGSVNSCPLGGCGAGPTLIGSTQDTPEAISLAPDGSIVWTRQSDGSVLRCENATCSTGMKVVATGGVHPIALATDATNAYWVDRGKGTVAMCPISGCGSAPTVIADGQIRPQGIAVVGNTVYWSASGTTPPVDVDGGELRDGFIRKCVIGPTCTPVDVARAQLAPNGIAVDTKSVYWVNEGINAAGDGTLMKAPL